MCQSGVEVQKAADTELVARGTLIVATNPLPAAVVMASGDRFRPLDEALAHIGQSHFPWP